MVPLDYQVYLDLLDKEDLREPKEKLAVLGQKELKEMQVEMVKMESLDFQVSRENKDHRETMALLAFLVLLDKKERWDQLVTLDLMDQRAPLGHEDQMDWLVPQDLQGNLETPDLKGLLDKLGLVANQVILVSGENQALVVLKELMDKMGDQVLQGHVEPQVLLV